MLKKTLLGAATALLLGSISIGINSTAQAQDIGFSIRLGPPEPRREYHPEARRGYTWAEGHWVWRGRQHTWVKGYWVRNQRGYRYEQAYWEQRGNRWNMHKGKWKLAPTGRDRVGGREHEDQGHYNPRR